ncbi:MAG: choice-of-anchor J domain-containing protein [Flavobacteriaceae bacterium]
MKTKLLLAGAFLAFFTGVKAQTTTIYSQDFTASTGLSIIDADGDTANWGLYSGNATTAGWGLTGNFAGSRSWNPSTGTPPGALTPDNYLLTPEVAIPDTFGTTTLSFKLGTNDVDFPAEHISVYLAPASANTAALISALTPVFTYTLTAANATTADVFSVDVTAYNGQSVKIVFRHHDCTDQDLLYLDDVLLTQETLSTQNFITSQFMVGPNPVNDVINISSKNNATISSISMTDMNGRVVKNLSFDNIAKTELNISDLSAGVYMMSMVTSKGNGTVKIVKK